ncbi:coiled-coil domain-containing protein [Candidatus Regiella insecticola]|uniref:DUF1640 domain-containing protein n=1 Tax=Candidatus Regiella insecticola TaxID=138073 RepID=A0A6L2ZLI9_9ENTR|nr:coiled-coil domain-containing protein [Candidatus Regiella insecticola]GFN45389.1 uncharacterized protein RINTU1_05140 [Candidatus Regiella insecticola]
MNQATFLDTHKIFKKLEKTGISTNQAEAFSEIFRESHEAVDVATRRDLEDVRKELSGDIAEVKRDIIDVRKDMEFRFEKTDAQIADVRKDMKARFEKTDAQIADVRKDMEARFEKTDAQIADVRKDMAARFEKTDAQIADVRKDFMTEMSLMRKDIEKSGMQTTIKLGGMLVVAVGVILTVLKMPF